MLLHSWLPEYKHSGRPSYWTKNMRARFWKALKFQVCYQNTRYQWQSVTCTIIMFSLPASLALKGAFTSRLKTVVFLYDYMSDTKNVEIPPEMAGANMQTRTTDESHNETTHFAEDTVGVVSDVVAQTNFDPQYLKSLVVPSSQTIVDFLQRPSILTTGNFTAGDTGILQVWNVTDAFTSYKTSRLNGIYTIRADFKFTIQVNADRFQAGRYILAWIPTGGTEVGGTSYTSYSYYNMKTANLTTITQLPHVEIDLNRETHATLDIPYTSIYPYLEWSNASQYFLHGLGWVILMTYSPLSPGTGGSSTAGYSVWASMENVTIAAVATNQMNSSTVESKAYGKAPITQALRTFSRATGALADIPILGPYAESVSWLSKVVSNSTEILGFSKPLNEEAPVRIVRQISPYTANIDNVSVAKPIGLMTSNSVVTHSGISRTNVDEMSFDFIKKQYAYFNTFAWITAATEGTLLATYTMAPSNYYTTWSKGSCYLPFAFFSNIFYRWRGGIVVRVKLVKTEFHRGRLMLVFSPGPSTTTPPMNTSEYVYREIVDVSATSEFEVCLPYLLSQPWSLFGTSAGVLAIYVLNPLVAPTTVATTINALVELRADDDYEVSCPWNLLNIEPYQPSTHQMGDPYTVTPCFKMGGASTVNVDKLLSYTIGEKISSVRALLKRVHMSTPTGNGATPSMGNGVWFQYFPYLIEPVYQAATTSGALQRGYMYSDMVGLWHCCYAMSTGTMRVVIRPSSTAGNTVFGASYSLNATTSTIYIEQSNYGESNDYQFHSLGVDGVFEIQCPAYLGLFGRSTQAQSINSTAAQFRSEPSNTGSVYVGDNLVATTVNIVVGRYVGDDYTMMRWTGVPPVVTTGAT